MDHSLPAGHVAEVVTPHPPPCHAHNSTTPSNPHPTPKMSTTTQALTTLHTTPTAPAATPALLLLSQTSKQSAPVRAQLAHPNSLRALVHAVRHALAAQPVALDVLDPALRCVGNACVAEDEAADAAPPAPLARHELAALGLDWARGAVDVVGTATLAVRVLYNVCVASEAARAACRRARVHHAVLRWGVTHDGGDGNDEAAAVAREAAAALLFWMCGEREEEEDVDDLGDAETAALLALPARWGARVDAEALAMVVETVLAYARDARFQERVVRERRVDEVAGVLEAVEAAIAAPASCDDDDDGERARLLVPLATGLVWCLSDVAATSGFARAYGGDAAWVAGQAGRIADAAAPGRVVGAACQMLGNVLWATRGREGDAGPAGGCALIDDSDDAGAMTVGLARGLWERVRTGDGEVQHSAAGLLGQLARRSERLCEGVGAVEGAREALEALCRHARPELQRDGIRLLQALGRHCAVNQRRFAELGREVVATTRTVQQGQEQEQHAIDEARSDDGPD